jgi:hypothetical protein
MTLDRPIEPSEHALELGRDEPWEVSLDDVDHASRLGACGIGPIPWKL